MTSLKSISIFAATAAIALGAAFYSAWSWRGSRAEEEKETAVASAVSGKVAEITAELAKERAAREQAQEESKKLLQGLSDQIRGIRATTSEVSRSLAEERERNRQFYDQPIPEGGRQQWLKSRARVEAATPSASSASR